MTPREQVTKIAEQALRELGEHCDAVQILTTWSEDGVTDYHYNGTGNWHTRAGMVAEMHLRNQERMKQALKRDTEDEEPET